MSAPIFHTSLFTDCYPSDYRGLKKRIGEIRRAHEGLQDGLKHPNDSEGPTGPNTSVPASPSSVVTRREFPSSSAKPDDGYLKAPDRPMFNRMPSQGAVSKVTGRTKRSLRGMSQRLVLY